MNEKEMKAMTMRVAVEFLKSTLIGATGYNTGEVAGFELGVARRLIEQGRARQANRTPVLVEVAANLPDPAIQKLAAALGAVRPRLEALAQRAAGLREQIRDLEQVEARSIAMDEPVPSDIAAQRHLMREDLERSEREIEVLAAQEQPLHAELEAAVRGYVERSVRAIVTEQVAPAFRHIDGLVVKADRAVEAVQHHLQRLEEVRGVARAAEVDMSDLAQVEAAALVAGLGDALAAAVTGGGLIPGDLAVLLTRLAERRTRDRPLLAAEVR